MAKFGIDTIGFYTSRYYLALEDLAKARDIDPDKFRVGLGQVKMAIPAPDDDIVTMGANAAKEALQQVNAEDIDQLIFATESSFDTSKCAGIYVHHLLKLPKNSRVIEFKQACYSATAALQYGLNYVKQNPKKKVLVVTSDVAHYALNSSGESSQGCGAVAMVLSIKPRLLAIEPGAGFYTEDVMDFWRPTYLETPLVEGKYSALIYLRSLEAVWKDFTSKTKCKFSDIDHFCYHTPVPKLVEKAHKLLLKRNNEKKDVQEISKSLKSSLHYGRVVGNTYSASLYVNLLSLLDMHKTSLKGKRIGFYSYGSGCMAEYFTGVVQNTYKNVLNTKVHRAMLDARKALSYEEYEKMYHFKLPIDGSEFETPKHDFGAFRLKGICNHQRQYEETPKPLFDILVKSNQTETERQTIEVVAPGKIIISGEHSVVYGSPAIAMAVDRYTHVNIRPQLSKFISFNLLKGRYQDSFTLNTLKKIKDKTKNKYACFLRGDCSVRDVLQAPFELAQFVFMNTFDHVNTKILNGLNVTTDSNIPIGCGMGSSAALILALTLAISRFLKIPLNEDRLLKLAFEAENLQHGKAGRIDLQACLTGGCLHYHEDHFDSMTVLNMPMYVVNTGTPETTTGECVSFVHEKVSGDKVWYRFSEVTQSIAKALLEGSVDKFKELVQENHRLLVELGVVPQKIQEFIAELSLAKAAAKVCGAGTMKGDKAGIVLLVSEAIEAIKPICDRYGYKLQPISVEAKGLHVR